MSDVRELMGQTIRRREVTPPALFDSFEQYVFESNREGKLEGVLWRSEFALRNPNDHTIVPSVLLRKRDGKVRVRCEICRVVFSSQRKASAHLPCRPDSRYKIVREGFLDLMTKMSTLGTLHIEQVEKLRNIILASTSDDAFLVAYEHGDADNAMELADYRAEWLLCFLLLIPQREINPRNVSRSDHRELRRVQKEFFRSRSKDQEVKWQSRIIREFFEPARELEQIAKPGVGQPPITLSEAELKAFQMNLPKRGRLLAVALQRDGIPYALKRYQDSPSAFSEWVRPRKEIARRQLENGIVPPLR